MNNFSKQLRLLFFFILLSPSTLFAANQPSTLWSDVSSREQGMSSAAVASELSVSKFRLIKGANEQLKSALSAAPARQLQGEGMRMRMDLALPDGGFATFRIFKSSIMHPALAKKYPEIQTY